MKINTKTVVFLIVSFILVSISSITISVVSLLSSQKYNLKVSKNELLETSRELVQDDAAFFFRLLDKQIQGNPSLSTQDFINITAELEPFSSRSVVIMDLKSGGILGGNGQSEISTLFDRNMIQRELNEMMLTRNKDFYLDNYDKFLVDRTGLVIPVAVHIRIYDQLGLIVGHGRVMKSALVRIAFMKEKNADYFRLYLLFSLIVYAVATSAVVFLSAHFMRIFFISPLKQIDDIVSRVTKGDLSARITIKSNDEIGDLARKFNEMTQELQKSTISIEDLNKEIAERKKIEEENIKHVKELEIFYRVSMGREERIIELKKEVERLKKESRK